MARRDERREANVPAEAAATRRQRLAALLEGEPRSPSELRAALGGSLRALEEDLRHVERSCRATARHFVVTSAACEACGFVFHGRESRHLHAPGRCPRCRSERIVEPRFRVEGGA